MNFHELCKTERPLILPGAFDAMSARLIQRAGFKAYFTGGFPTIGARWGLPDIGLVALGEDRLGRQAVGAHSVRAGLGCEVFGEQLDPRFGGRVGDR